MMSGAGAPAVQQGRPRNALTLPESDRARVLLLSQPTQEYNPPAASQPGCQFRVKASLRGGTIRNMGVSR